jgi:hypothetical protein
MNPQAKAGGGKVRKVMHEFRSGSLKSSSGQKVTNPKQAMAIALSEQRRVKHMQVGGLARGGHLSPDVRFDKFIGSDRTMGADYVKAERKQARLASGAGGAGAKVNIPNTRHGKIDMPYHSLKRMTGMQKGGKVKEAQMEMRHAKAMKKAGLPKSMVREEMAEAKKYARGGGIESRGKTKGTVIKMAGGGHVRGGGCEQRGKTKGKMV